MSRFTLTLAVLCLLAGAGATFASGGHGKGGNGNSNGGGVPPIPHFAGAWSHAEINVRIRRQPHTLILDHGQIVQASATQITLREFDGSIVVVPLTAETRIIIGRRKGAPSDLRRKMTAETMRIDGGAAVRVLASVH
ncbi:MAG TPA: hypothetical protein VNC40_01680 [Gaiellaceae bacterium]|nr:hypothetical protein [Gaiellaceae bacterium]